MPQPPPVVAWLTSIFPRPRVDPEWLDGCYEWLTSNQHHDPGVDLPAFVNALQAQVLGSNLQDSMLHGTGIPLSAALPTTTTTLTGPPILVEIISITEIASSAVNLNNIRVAREERIRAGQTDEGGGEEADLDLVDEGPMPSYPRGMLKLEISDGATTLPAIEYRRLPELSLEKTCLGYKMQLKDVFICQGVAFLEPKTVIMRGGRTQDRDENREHDFANSLRVRMRLPPIPGAVPDDGAPEPARVRSPLSDIPAPPSPPITRRNDDSDMPSRRRRVPLTRSSSSGPSTARSSTLVPSTNPTPSTISPYFNSSSSTRVPSTASRLEPQLDHFLSPPAQARPFPPASFDFELVEELDRDSINHSATGVSASSQAPMAHNLRDNVSDYGMGSDDYDDAILDEIQQLEQEALSTPATHPSSSVRSSDAQHRLPLSSGKRPPEVVTLLSDEDDSSPGIDVDMDDKENIPLPSRRVRPRVEQWDIDELSPDTRDLQERRGAFLSQEEIINISDSD